MTDLLCSRQDAAQDGNHPALGRPQLAGDAIPRSGRRRRGSPAMLVLQCVPAGCEVLIYARRFAATMLVCCCGHRSWVLGRLCAKSRAKWPSRSSAPQVAVSFWHLVSRRERLPARRAALRPQLTASRCASLMGQGGCLPLASCSHMSGGVCRLSTSGTAIQSWVIDGFPAGTGFVERIACSRNEANPAFTISKTP